MDPQRDPDGDRGVNPQLKARLQTVLKRRTRARSSAGSMAGKSSMVARTTARFSNAVGYDDSAEAVKADAGDSETQVIGATFEDRLKRRPKSMKGGTNPRRGIGQVPVEVAFEGEVA